MINEHLLAQIEQIAKSDCDVEESHAIYEKLKEVFSEEELYQLGLLLTNPAFFCSHTFPAFVAGLYAMVIMLQQRVSSIVPQEPVKVDNPQVTELDRLWKL